MRNFIVFCCIVFATRSAAQFAIGNQSMTYTDLSRNRDLPFELLYPASTAGTGVSCAEGVFPYVVLAHGFSMQATDYTYMAEELAANGYVVLQLATESGFAPSHEDYALDILFLATHFREENLTNGSLFAGHVLAKVGVIGHSMGGGATWLAAAQANGNIDCLVGMAPAETTPSAIDAAPDVTIPAIIFSGSSDAVTPPAQHHQPIFEATSATCKIFVNVLEGSHCGFADGGTLCQFGELGFNGLAADVQQSIALDLVNAWMDWHLKDVASAENVIASYDGTQSHTQMQISCLTSNLAATDFSRIAVYPNPCDTKLYVVMTNESHSLHLCYPDGKCIPLQTLQFSRGKAEWDVSVLAPGIYTLIDSADGSIYRFIVR